MTPEQSARIFGRLAFIETARKTFDAEPKWVIIQDRLKRRLSMVVAVRLNGVLAGGVAIRINTPEDAWESDVYGHVEVTFPQINHPLRLDPVEWRPRRFHDNPAVSPPAHRNVRLYDRHLPLHLNEPLGLDVFRQTQPGVAVPLPRPVNDFRGYSDMCADIWRCPDMHTLVPPPWTKRLA